MLTVECYCMGLECSNAYEKELVNQIESNDLSNTVHLLNCSNKPLENPKPQESSSLEYLFILISNKQFCIQNAF